MYAASYKSSETLHAYSYVIGRPIWVIILADGIKRSIFVHHKGDSYGCDSIAKMDDFQLQSCICTLKV